MARNLVGTTEITAIVDGKIYYKTRSLYLDGSSNCIGSLDASKRTPTTEDDAFFLPDFDDVDINDKDALLRRLLDAPLTPESE